MKIFNCILGVFSVFASLYCIFYPGITFLNSGWIVAILLSVFGICSIFDYFTRTRKENKSKSEAAWGIAGLVFGIAAAVISVLAVFIPAVRLVFDVVIIYMFVSWLIISGIGSIVNSVQIKKNSDSKIWILTLIMGILVVLAGVYGVFHMLFIARTIGMLIGIELMAYGIRLIISVFEKEA